MAKEIILALFCGGAAAAFVSGIFSVVLWILTNKKAKDDQSTDIKEGLQVLLFHDIKKASLEYIAAGEIYAEDLEDIKRMHAVYHDKLNGNGYLDNIMQKVDKLPIKSD